MFSDHESYGASSASFRCDPSVALGASGSTVGRCASSQSVRPEVAGVFSSSSSPVQPLTVQALLDLTTVLLRSILVFFRGRNQQAIVEMALRQQLATYAQTRPKPNLTPLDRAFWVALFRLLAVF